MIKLQPYTQAWQFFTVSCLSWVFGHAGLYSVVRTSLLLPWGQWFEVALCGSPPVLQSYVSGAFWDAAAETKQLIPTSVATTVKNSTSSIVQLFHSAFANGV